MKIAEIYTILDEIAPFCEQESWDNSGLLIGNMDDEITKIYASLDIDTNLANSLENGSLIITHHPLIFSGLKKFDTKKYPSNLIKILIQKDIKLIAMHTNFDKFVLNKFVAKSILGYEIYDEKDFLVFMNSPFKDFGALCKDIKAKFKIENLRVVKAKNSIQTLALCTGSGADLLENLSVDCFLTGDLKYHTALQSLENGVSLIDINHFESERYFGASLQENLKKKQIEVIITNSINPFSYFKGNL
ncbi:MAG: Nif3-like dinuclear metal center hexameric protein [Campylobacter sp.]|nr:Nif3-like dinuclear metal center hexameric protein [Campylobacter sp.]